MAGIAETKLSGGKTGYFFPKYESKSGTWTSVRMGSSRKNT
jgi:hypothetical protein